MSISSYVQVTASWPEGTETAERASELLPRSWFFTHNTWNKDGRVYVDTYWEDSYPGHVLEGFIELFGRPLDQVPDLFLHCHYETNCVDEGFFGCDLVIKDGKCTYSQSVIEYKDCPMSACPIKIAND